jgi:aryl-alcohol dehydrogenase-like predicted oxidoreductase
MKSVLLGHTGLSVSNLCLGTMQFGWTAGEEDSFAVMDAFIQAGGNFIDTADIYSIWAQGNPGGVAEEIIGRWMKSRINRDSIFIATKLRGKMWDGPDGEGLSRAHIERAIQDSLRRLQIEAIDLYQCHWADEGVPIDETLTVFGELIASGKARYVGASNYTPNQLDEAMRTTGDGIAAFATLQPHYNLVHRSEYEGALEGICRKYGLGIIPYSPLAGGFLSGKYRRGESLPDSQRASGVRKYVNDDGFAVLDAVQEIAQARGTAIPAVAVAWLIAKGTIPIIGANTVAQLEEILPAADLALTADEVQKLDQASAGYA